MTNICDAKFLSQGAHCATLRMSLPVYAKNEAELLYTGLSWGGLLVAFWSTFLLTTMTLLLVVGTLKDSQNLLETLAMEGEGEPSWSSCRLRPTARNSKCGILKNIHRIVPSVLCSALLLH